MREEDTLNGGVHKLSRFKLVAYYTFMHRVVKQLHRIQIEFILLT